MNIGSQSVRSGHPWGSHFHTWARNVGSVPKTMFPPLPMCPLYQPSPAGATITVLAALKNGGVGGIVGLVR